MSPQRPSAVTSEKPFDVAIVGAGAVGLALALALSRSGFAVCLVGPPSPVRSGRTVALLDGSVELLKAMDVWPQIEPVAAPLRRMVLVDATGSLFRPLPTSFRAQEIGIPTFGFNVENSDLESILLAAALRTGGLTLQSGMATDIRLDAQSAVVRVDNADEIRARVIVAADGRQSRIRKMARIGVRTTAHPQVALTGIFSHEAAHGDASTEFHTRQGPFTLVPLRDHGDGTARSSLVWVMSPAEAERRRKLDARDFAAEAESQCARLLGSMRLESALGLFPIVTSVSTRLTARRLALTGEAAHALPPIGAQGLNLSFRDIGTLVDLFRAASERGQDIGSSAVLDAYERSRSADIAGRALGVRLLNNALLADAFGMDLLRGAGLTALGAVGPLRRLVMRHGLAPDRRSAIPHA